MIVSNEALLKYHDRRICLQYEPIDVNLKKKYYETYKSQKLILMSHLMSVNRFMQDFLQLQYMLFEKCQNDLNAWVILHHFDNAKLKKIRTPNIF